VTFALLLAAASSAQGALHFQSLGDLNQLGAGTNPHGMTEVGGDLYLATDGPGSAETLWRRDGVTGELTKLIESRNSNRTPFRDFVTMGGDVYFSAGADGQWQLYRTDGTAAGTKQIGDVKNVLDVIRVGDRLYFRGDYAPTGGELWTSDGTSAGTVLVKDIRLGKNSSSPAELTPVAGGFVFSAYDGTERHLWRSDGTALGTEELHSAVGATLVGPEEMTQIGSGDEARVLFAATTADAGRELWRTDGTSGGTDLVLDHRPGPTNGNPEHLTRIGDTVYYKASNGQAPFGGGVWRTDGTTAGTAHIAQADNPHEFAVAGPWLYWVDQTERELWRSNGTGADQVFDEDDYGDHYVLHEPTAVGSDLYFVASEGGYDSPDEELWKVGEDAAPPARVTEFYAGDHNDHVSDLVVHQGSLFFSASDPSHGEELWRTVALAGMPVLDADIDPGTLSSNPEPPVAVSDSRFFFVASNGVDDQNLWVSDGTRAGTENVPFGEPDSIPDTELLTAVDGDLYFVAEKSLWRVPAGSSGPAEKLGTWSGVDPVDNLVEWRGHLYFRVTDTAAAGLWTTDGTAAGTTRVASLPTAQVGKEDEAVELVAAGDALYMAARDSGGEAELWRSDGTSAGTVKVLDVPRGIFDLTADDRGAFFTMFPKPDFALWHTDGTTAGTLPLQSFQPENFNGWPRDFTLVGSRVYFSAEQSPEEEGGTGTEPWVSDGTSSGTHIVEDLKPGSSYGDSYPFAFHGVGNRVFFLAGGDGGPLFRSDGDGAKAIKGPHRSLNVTERDLESIGERLLTYGGRTTGNQPIYELRTNDPDAETSELDPADPSRIILETTTIGSRLFLEMWKGGTAVEPWIASYDEPVEDPYDPPDTAIVARPPAEGNGSVLAFTYRGTPEDATDRFECRLDGAAFAPCPAEGFEAGHLDDGPHTFEVRALDAAGHPDRSPATASFRIDSSPPQTSLIEAPASVIATKSARFRFSSEQGARFECDLDGLGYAPCTSPQTRSGLEEGAHVFSVRAVDAVGNADRSPATTSFTVDTRAPTTTLDATPPAASTDRDPSFSFSADEEGASFRCRLDLADYAPCSSPVHLVGVTDGEHRFQVLSTDPAGNVEASPMSYGFSIDTSGPDTHLDAAPGPLGNTRHVSFSFGASEPDATFECRIGSDSFEPCSSPHPVDVASDGPYRFEVRAVDALGNRDGTAASGEFEVDSRAPLTELTTKPPADGSEREVSFGFEADEPGVTFECGVDGDEFEPCTAPHRTTLGTDGAHLFEVRAADPAGNLGPATAYDFAVDSTGPQTRITSTPPAAGRSRQVRFEFESDEGDSQFECRLGGSPFSPCNSGDGVEVAGDGTHVFEVRSFDAHGNPDPTPARFAFDVDTSAPDTSITSGPPPALAKREVTFGFSSDEPGARYECSIDAGAYSPCEPGSPVSVPADGAHTFRVRAIDAVGNTDPTPAEFSFDVDTRPPETTIRNGPPAVGTSERAAFEFSSDETSSTFLCRLGQDPFRPCDSRHVADAAGDGAHRFQVRAVDAVGNQDPSPATYVFEIDREGPETAIIRRPRPRTPAKKHGARLVFGFQSEPGAVFECRRDNAEFHPCASPWRVRTGRGDHQFQIRAVDELGNEGPPVSLSVRVTRAR
jgi:ELWxxDGT repeat protein